MKLVFENQYIKVFHGSFTNMPSLNYQFDAIITDPPYGMTNNFWDIRVDFNSMWHTFKAVKANAYTPIILFGDFPFSIDLINSKRNWYRYSWYWNKKIGTGFLDSAYKPLKVIEHIHVFLEKPYQLLASREIWKKQDRIAKFYPQFTKGKPNHSSGNKLVASVGTTYKTHKTANEIKKSFSHDTTFYRTDLARIGKKATDKHPKNYLEFQKVKPNKYIKLHPNEKPLALIEYLIKTYTKANDLVLDCFAGNGVTAIACMKLQRRCILVEKEQEYIDLIIKKIKQQEQNYEASND